MTDPLDRLRPLLGPDWAAFLRQLRADLGVQRATLAAPKDVRAAENAAHVVVALAGTAGDETVVRAARVRSSGAASADLLPLLDALLARLDRLAGGSAA
jgi:hypothetical protein